jgi:DDE superfamily endonuclease
MDQLIPSLAALVEPFRDCFRVEVFQTFQALLAGWILCNGPRTISGVWQATGLAARRHHDTAYAVFHSAVWEWDDLGIVLATLILAHLIPGGIVWLVVDDTLCHKRGAKVAFGGIFLDPVLSSKRHKTLRFGVNWVVLGIAVPIPFRPDRHYCFSVLWRAFRKKGNPDYKSRPQIAAELARQLAEAHPERVFWLAGDSAYINATTLQGRPKNLHMVGPLNWTAALYAVPEPPPAGRKGGRPRKKGKRLPRPQEMIEDTVTYPAEVRTIEFPKGRRDLRIQVVRNILWYRGCQTEPVVVVLIRDPLGQWRDEALVATDPSVSAEFLITGYCRRWSVEVAFADAKQMLGFQDPQVWSALAVERAAPMAWFVATLVVCWYAEAGQYGRQAQRHRPWYKDKETPTFADMLATCRLQLWQGWLRGESGSGAGGEEKLAWLLEYIATSN